MYMGRGLFYALTLLSLFLINPALSFELNPVSLTDKPSNALKAFSYNLAVDPKVPDRTGAKVFSKRAVRKVEKKVMSDGKAFKYLATGALKGNSNMTVIFLHGRGGTRHLGFSDKKFKGNFKQLKDLMFQNGGIYVSTDVTSFGEDGGKGIARIIKSFRKKTSKKLVLACGSMGSFICWQMARDAKVAKMVDAYVFLGGFPDPTYLETGKLEVFKHKPTLYFSHGSRDKVYSSKHAIRYSRALKRKSPRYPVKVSLINGGQHNDPIKEINWRSVLNWIAKQ